MTFTRISKLGILMLGVAVIGISQPVYAGFEFSGPSAPAAKAPTAPEDAIDAPMPIVPMEDVTAVPLDSPKDANPAATAPTAKPHIEHMLKAPAKAAAHTPQAEPVYIRRQRGITMKAPKNQPMDMEALLKATENAEPVSLEGAPRVNLAETPAPVADGKLAINPYPLESQSGATHGGGLGTLATEQALMEQSGSLRAVEVPGKKAPGMIARAKITSRYDSSSQYLDRTPATEDAAVFGLASSMTPIPGGEGAPITEIAAVPLPPPTHVAAAPAAPRSITPAAVMPTPRAPEEKALVEERVSSMPRPAIPEGYPQPIAPAANAGGFTEAVGFGRDLPLALALSQVVPPEYTYAFGSDVNVGSTVSWQGGKAWNLVLDEMLATQGLRAVISGNQITIVSASQPA